MANVGIVHEKFGVDVFTGFRTGICESLKTRVSRPYSDARICGHVYTLSFHYYTLLMAGNHFGRVFRVARSKYKLAMTPSLEMQDGGCKPEAVIFGHLL